MFILINKLKEKLRLSQDKKNVAKISFGTLIGQGISFITLPIFTRLYGAEIIGIWTLFQSIAGIVNSFSDLGLTNSIMTEEEEKKMLKIYKVVSTIVLIFSILTGIVLFLYYNIMPNPNKLNVIFIGSFILVAVFTLQQIQVCYTWLNRKGEYKILMRNPIINNFSFGLSSIILGLLGFKLYGYFIGWILGQVLTLINMKRELPKSMFTLRLEDYKEVFLNHKRFLIYQLPTNIISNVKNQLPVLCIKIFFGAKILGYYSISVRLLQIPITFLATAIGRVFFQKASDMKRAGKEIGTFVYMSMTRIMKLAVIPMIGMVAVGDVAVKIFLGYNWIIAGDLLRILAFQNFFLFLMFTVQGLSIILDKQNYAMVSCLFQSIGVIIGLGVGRYLFNNIYIGIILMTLSFIIINIIYFCAMFKAMNISIKKYLLNITFYTILMLGISLVLRFGLYKIGIVAAM